MSQCFKRRSTLPSNLLSNLQVALKATLKLGAGLTLLSALSAPAFAWEPLNGNYPRWPTLPVPYEVNASSAQELGASSAVRIIETSYSTWASQSCSGYRTQNRGNTQGSWRSGDGLNTHLWIYNRSSRPAELSGRETIGVTLTLYRGDTIVDGDILYNGIDHSWTTNPTRSGQVDAESIITHETGHQLGLGHSSSTRATMYYAYVGGTGARSLDSDDIEGVCTLYPGSGATSCNRDSDCDSGEVCSGGTCVTETQGDGGVGESCATNECASGLICIQGGGEPFCTLICEGGDCPSGWGCQGVNSSQGAINLCLPSAEEAGDARFGDGCEAGPECASGLCVSDGQRAFCSEVCVEDSGCPDEATCYALSDGGGACVPAGGTSSGGYGDSCNDASDCDNEICLDDGEAVYCSELCEDDGDCPSGSACYALESGEGVCVIESAPSMPSEPTQGFDEACESSDECLSGLCVDDGERSFCSAECAEDSDCPPSAVCAELSDGGGACLPVDEPVAPPAECEVDQDCPGAEVCEGGACVEPAPSPEAGVEADPSNLDEPFTPEDDVFVGEGEETSNTQIADDLGCDATQGSTPTTWLLLIFALFNLMIRRRETPTNPTHHTGHTA